MICKLCDNELVALTNTGLFCCPSDSHVALAENSHTYTTYTPPDLGPMEDISAIGDNANERYCCWIQHKDKQTQIRIMVGLTAKANTTLNIALEIDNTTTEEFIEKIKKLMLLA